MVQKIYQQKFHWTTIYIHLPSRKLRAHHKMNGLEDDPFLFWQVWTVSFRYGKSKDRADHRGEVTNASSPQNNWMSSSQPPSEVTMDSLASQGRFFFLLQITTLTSVFFWLPRASWAAPWKWLPLEYFHLEKGLRKVFYWEIPEIMLDISKSFFKNTGKEWTMRSWNLTHYPQKNIYRNDTIYLAIDGQFSSTIPTFCKKPMPVSLKALVTCCACPGQNVWIF